MARILIIDDDKETRERYVDVFKSGGFEVVEAIDGADGLDKAVKNKPDVIFTGILMPKLDGFELTAELKQNAATANIPVVISSHMGREEDRKKAASMGIKDFIARDLVTPLEAVQRIKAIFNLQNYKIKFSPTELDAPKMAKELEINPEFKCPSCRETMIISLEPAGKNHSFTAAVICPRCGKSI
ncbi:MAG: response regulator [Candidatus Moranbacteria bacterium]|nr:response regulator [Candidatus Moranbacteria bacterium]